MEYESETIELYEMISDEFDYDKLRKESEFFKEIQIHVSHIEELIIGKLLPFFNCETIYIKC